MGNRKINPQKATMKSKIRLNKDLYIIKSISDYKSDKKKD